MGESSHVCMCSKRRQKQQTLRRRERCRRIRRTLICDHVETYRCEPCMQHLQEEYSQPDTECKSGVELPWKEFAISASELAAIVKKDVDADDNEEEKSDTKTLVEELEEDEEVKTVKSVSIELVRQDSSGILHLPWEEMIVTDTVQSVLAKQQLEYCDSNLEIPWKDILYSNDLKLEASDEDLIECNEDVVEIPWKDLLIPNDIDLTPKKKSRSKKRYHRKCQCSKARNRKHCC